LTRDSGYQRFFSHLTMVRQFNAKNLIATIVFF